MPAPFAPPPPHDALRSPHSTTSAACAPLDAFELKHGLELGLSRARLVAASPAHLFASLHGHSERSLCPASGRARPSIGPPLPPGVAYAPPRRVSYSAAASASAPRCLLPPPPDHAALLPATMPPSAAPPPLTPNVYAEEPPFCDSPASGSRSAGAARSNGAGSSSGSSAKPSTPACRPDAQPEIDARFHRADGIGGFGQGTAATGDRGAQARFETLDEIRTANAELTAEYAARHAGAPLSGRIIHVSHYLPFVIRARAEVEHERQREQRVSATANVAAMAAAARAKKAARLAAQQAEGLDATAGKNRKGSFIDGMHETTDLAKKLAENQARSRVKAGRRAWMMTPVVDDEDEEDLDALPKDTFTPIGSRRQSAWSEASRHMSFSQHLDDNHFSAVSDENSPARTPQRVFASTPPPPPPPPPEWVLAPRRGHTALNSGIRSLCATHAQTFIGWPGDIAFAAQAKNDERKDASETTPKERGEIEGVLASLDDARNWAAYEPADTGAGAPQQGKVPTPMMNGAEPVDASGQPGKAVEHGIKYVPVWLDYNVAHGHYEGYCKTSECG
jgi:hypothetical protein